MNKALKQQSFGQGMQGLLKNLFRANPIIVKEIRSRMRGGRAFITLTVILVLMAGLMYAMLQIILASTRYTTVLSPQIGQGLFSALAFLELFMICAVTPAVTAGAISGEKEKQTYEMLMSTPLSPTSILWGKLISALSYVLLLLFAAVPLASIVFIFGGVAPMDMIKALGLLLVIAIAFGILGLFMSALFGRTGRATVAAFIAVVLLMVGPLFLAGLVGILQSSEPPRWLLAPSPISALSATLASSMGRNGLGDFFYILGGIFNMGVMPVDQNSVPRPLYHYTIPFYAILSVILYMLSTRLVQPTRRWRIRPKELVIGIGTLALMIGAVVGGFLLTARNYEWARNPNQLIDPSIAEPAWPAMPLPAEAVEREVIVGREEANTEGLNAPVEEETSAETHAEIYAAIARQFYTVDHTFGSNPPNWSNLYLLSTTDDGVGDPNVPRGDPTAIPEEVQTTVAEQLNKDLGVNVVWAESREAVPSNPDTGQIDDGNGAIITFGNLHVQDDGTMHVSASLYFASLGATGKTYILSNENGSWEIIGTTGAEWIS